MLMVSKKNGKEGRFNFIAHKSEIGGLVKIIEGKNRKKLAFIPYEPTEMNNNKKYSLNYFNIIDEALCDFHFHATSISNHRDGVATPSDPDLKAIYNEGRSGVVITTIGTDEAANLLVNIDYYTEKVVIDLGDYNTNIKLKGAVTGP